MRDVRRAPFCWQSCDAMAAIRERWSGKQRTTAIAVYQALTELANEARADRFRSPRPAVAERAGVSDRTVDAYAPGLEELGLLRRHQEKRADGLNLPNEWELLGGELASPRSEAASPGGGEANRPPTQERKGRKGVDQEARPEVERLCSLMAALQNERLGRDEYEVTDRWRRDVRLLLDRDGRSPEAVERCLRWIDRDDFWAGNILSPAKLRKQWATLEMQAKRRRNGSGPAPSDDDDNARAIRHLRAQGLDDVADELERDG